jgi:NADPH:quinone reductase-like Zn-dependent oxidoreductase
MRLLASGVAALLLMHPAQAAETMRQYQFEQRGETYEIVMKEVPRPEVGAREVLVRMHAAALNRRDVMILANLYGPGAIVAGSVPLSDGAGEVVAVGADVTRFEVGDRVAGIFFQHWLEGPPDARVPGSARGGGSGGMLSEFVLSGEDSLVEIPEHLSWEEAATLPCAAVTAWVSLFQRGHLAAGDFVLLEGTGGVSVFGLLFSVAAGAKPIITSSSDDKLAHARQLGAFGTVNYRDNADWQIEVRELTGGAGVDQVLEVGGKDTLGKALQALAYGGHIALIGGLSGFAEDLPVAPLMFMNATASGIYVGSRDDFEAMNRFISVHKIRPVVDRVFGFDEAPAAFDYMTSGNFMGKIVIRME